MKIMICQLGGMFDDFFLVHGYMANQKGKLVMGGKIQFHSGAPNVVHRKFSHSTHLLLKVLNLPGEKKLTTKTRALTDSSVNIIDGTMEY